MGLSDWCQSQANERLTVYEETCVKKCTIIILLSAQALHKGSMLSAGEKEQSSTIFHCLTEHSINDDISESELHVNVNDDVPALALSHTHPQHTRTHGRRVGSVRNSGLDVNVKSFTPLN